MSVKIWGNKILLVSIGISSVALTYTFYKFLKQYFQQETSYKCRAKKSGVSQKRVLVLGLVGAGKSRLLQCFQENELGQTDGRLTAPTPTLGYNVVSTRMGGVTYQFFEGAFDAYWDPTADALIWVVDSSSPEAFRASRLAMHSCVARIDRLSAVENKDDSTGFSFGIPVILVASKQDLCHGNTPTDVHGAMCADKLTSRHKVYTVGTHVPDVGKRKGLWRLYELVAFSDRKQYRESWDTCAAVKL